MVNEKRYISWKYKIVLILIGILYFFVQIGFHEYGHYTMAKKYNADPTFSPIEIHTESESWMMIARSVVYHKPVSDITIQNKITWAGYYNSLLLATITLLSIGAVGFFTRNFTFAILLLFAITPLISICITSYPETTLQDDDIYKIIHTECNQNGK